jgi:N-acetylneuraminic acid mutarotase
MDEIVRQVLLVPMMIIALVVALRDSPQRIFQPSDLPMAQSGEPWKKAAPLLTQRYDFGGAVWSDQLYVVGGLVVSSPWVPTNRVEAFDPKTNAWKRVADYPRVVHHPGVVSCKDGLYVVGGYWFRIFPSPLVHRYDAHENAWVKLADIPEGRGALAVACDDEYIYAMGGEAGSKQHATVYAYDIHQNRWEERTPMPTAREHFVAIAARGKIHAIGGLSIDRFNPLAVHEVYDPMNNTWTSVAALPRPLSGFAATLLGDSIFVFGGASGDTVSNEVYEYKIQENRWYRRSDMPSRRYGLVVGAIQNSIYVIGGNSVVKGNFFLRDNDMFTP